jgi:hypothetical protein
LRKNYFEAYFKDIINWSKKEVLISSFIEKLLNSPVIVTGFLAGPLR